MQPPSSGEDWFEVHNEPLSHACFFVCVCVCKVVAHEDGRVGRHYVLIICVSSSSETKRDAFLLSSSLLIGSVNSKQRSQI